MAHNANADPVHDIIKWWDKPRKTLGNIIRELRVIAAGKLDTVFYAVFTRRPA